MRKSKTHKSISKRIKVTARGKLKRRRPGASHLKSVKSPKRIRRFRKDADFPKAFAKQARKMLGI
ncbi:MAG TPA: bL35 family ribosomal protein [Phycisphaerae bacterium]|nr:bL35 family ribosomal protein [Phycisphaerae bacterium]